MNTYLVDIATNDYLDFIATANSVHQDGLLSRTPNIAGTKELIKVKSNEILNHKCIIKRYDTTNKKEIFKFFYTPEWQPSEKDY